MIETAQPFKVKTIPAGPFTERVCSPLLYMKIPPSKFGSDWEGSSMRVATPGLESV